MDNLISRQAAIDAVLDRMNVEKYGRNAKPEEIQWALEKLPSAQPELIRCKNCKHNQLPATSGNASCEIFYGMTDQNGFCHMAERRTDE